MATNTVAMETTDFSISIPKTKTMYHKCTWPSYKGVLAFCPDLQGFMYDIHISDAILIAPWQYLDQLAVAVKGLRCTIAKD